MKTKISIIILFVIATAVLHLTNFHSKTEMTPIQKNS